ncbi:unnamed protein product [Enterobius vermicularis]|uniref:F-box domain-containing protein n=1 Tax=Enterobius vermicularis TaxID=51028 RepID=A0A0N4VC99_ENTVE|nr:unnamed protein product [Enterobius vermicularis]
MAKNTSRFSANRRIQYLAIVFDSEMMKLSIMKVISMNSTWENLHHYNLKGFAANNQLSPIQQWYTSCRRITPIVNSSKLRLSDGEMLSLPVPSVYYIALLVDPFTVCRLSRSCRYLYDIVAMNIKRLPRPSFHIRADVFKKAELEKVLSQLKYGKLCAMTVEIFGDSVTEVERVIDEAKITDTDEYYFRWLRKGNGKARHRASYVLGLFDCFFRFLSFVSQATPRFFGDRNVLNNDLIDKQYNLLSHTFNGKHIDLVTIRGVPNTIQNVLAIFLKFFMSSDERLQKRRSARISFSTETTVAAMDRELHDFLNWLGLHNVIEEDLSILYYTRKITFVSHAKYRLCILVVCPLQGIFLVSLSCNGVNET